jgi:hypothetical protein
MQAAFPAGGHLPPVQLDATRKLAIPGPVLMRIEVVGNETITPQARRYAEYRVFAALTQSAATRNARRARVTLRVFVRRVW